MFEKDRRVRMTPGRVDRPWTERRDGRKDVRDCLRAALNCAVDDELISRNVVKLVKLPAVRKKKGRRWTSEQARRFLASAREDGDPYYAAYVLILIEGLRKGEVLGMTVDAPDFERLTVRIEHQLQRVGRALLHRETNTATAVQGGGRSPRRR